MCPNVHSKRLKPGQADQGHKYSDPTGTVLRIACGLRSALCELTSNTVHLGTIWPLLQCMSHRAQGHQAALGSAHHSTCRHGDHPKVATATTEDL